MLLQTESSQAKIQATRFAVNRMINQSFLNRLATSILMGGMTIAFGADSVKKTVSILQTPSASSRIYNPFPHFTWTEHPDAFREVGEPVSYQIQIASDIDFRNIIDQDTVLLNRYIHDRPLTNGAYYWRVRAIPHEKTVASWSASQSFIVLPCEEEIRVRKPEENEDHAALILEAVERAQELSAQGRSVSIVFPKEDYHVNQDFRGALIDLTAVENISIDGSGARLFFTNRRQGILGAQSCRNIQLMNFKSYFADGALRMQGWVTAVDREANKVTVAPDQGSHYFNVDELHPMDIAYLLHPTIDGRLKTGAHNYFRSNGDYRRNPDGTWSFTLQRFVEDWEVGDRFGYNFRKGSESLVHLDECEYVTAYKIATGGWGHLGFAAWEGSVFNVLHCETFLQKGKWMTGVADGVHVRGYRFGPWIEGTRIQAIGDDSVALYARPASIQSLHPYGKAKTVLCKNHFFNLEKGDDVTFFQPIGGRILLETVVTEVRWSYDSYHEVTFRDEIPEDLIIEGPLIDATQIWNRSKSSGDFMIRNSAFVNIRRFGTVFRARRGVVENNDYSGNSSEAILFWNETPWPNGLYASEIIIRNNRISDVGFDSKTGNAPISMRFTARHKGPTSHGPRNLLIEGNTFENTPSPEINLIWAKNIVLRNNRVKRDSNRFDSATYKASNSVMIRETEK